MTRNLSRFRGAPLAIAATVLLALALSLSPAASPIPEASSASSDYFLKIEGVPGESKADGHAGEIDVLSWSWGMSNSGSAGAGGGGGAGKASFSDLSLTKRIDKSSPLLMRACATGEHIPKAVLTAKRVGPKGTDYIRYTLENALCVSLQDAGTPGEAPSESISLNYEKIKFEYRAENELRWSEFGWDLATNEAP